MLTEFIPATLIIYIIFPYNAAQINTATKDGFKVLIQCQQKLIMSVTKAEFAARPLYVIGLNRCATGRANTKPLSSCLPD